MSETTWEIKLANDVSAAAKAASTDLRGVSEAAREAQDRLNSLGEAEHKEAEAAHEGKEAHEGFFGEMFSAEVLAERFNELTDKIVEMGVELAKSAIEATDFDYKATVALTHLTGSAEQAEDIIAHARAFANGVGEDIDKVVIGFQHLAATGLRGDQLTAAAGAARDLAIATGRGTEQTQQLFEMIGSDRGLGGRAVRQLSQFPQLLQELERHFGVLGHSNGIKELEERLTAAPLKGAAGLQLLEGMIVKATHENAIGDLSTEAGKTIEGSLVKLHDDWKEILGDMAHSPAFEELRTSFADLAKFFDPATESGKEAEQQFAKVMQPLLDGVTKLLENPDAIKEFFTSGLEVAKAFGTVVEGTAHAIEAIAHWTAAPPSPEAQKTSDFDLPTEEAHPLLREWKNRIFGEGNENAGTPIPPGTPSFDDGGDVTRTGMAFVHRGERVETAGKAEASGSGGGHVFNFHLSVGKDSGMDEQTLAARMEEMLPGAIINALEQMNQMRGGR